MLHKLIINGQSLS